MASEFVFKLANFAALPALVFLPEAPGPCVLTLCQSKSCACLLHIVWFAWATVTQAAIIRPLLSGKICLGKLVGLRKVVSPGTNARMVAGMHTVDLLERASQLARQLGYKLREDWLGGSGGGPCEIKGQKWLFLDLALSPAEQLEQVATAIRSELAAASRVEGAVTTVEVPSDLRRALRLKKTA